MNIEEQKANALNQCIDIANDYSEEEIRKFFPPSVQKAWEIGNNFLNHQLKEDRKKRKKLVL
jgi:hypothetical protein